MSSKIDKKNEIFYKTLYVRKLKFSEFDASKYNRSKGGKFSI